MLVFVCSPNARPLKSAPVEAFAVAAAAQRAGKRAYIQPYGDGQLLRRLLADLTPRMLLFVGHADATHPYSREYTLGLTDENGGLVRLLPETLVDVLGSAKLELVVLNGCESEALGIEVAKSGGVATVCWRTKLLDEVAALYSPALFEHLLHPVSYTHLTLPTIYSV